MNCGMQVLSKYVTQWWVPKKARTPAELVQVFKEAVERAERGEVDRLRWRFAGIIQSHLVELGCDDAAALVKRAERFVTLPKLPSKKRWSAGLRSDPRIADCVQEYYRIHDLWRRHHLRISRGGKSWPAARFAAEIVLMDDDGSRGNLEAVTALQAAIINRLKKSKRPAF